MKTVINIVLAACVIGLIYVCYGSIVGPINFDNTKKAREKQVIARLIDIRKAQLEYRNLHAGAYTASFDTLIDFVKTAKLPFVKKEGVLSDAQLEAGMTEKKAMAIINKAKKTGNWKEVEKICVDGRSTRTDCHTCHDVIRCGRDVDTHGCRVYVHIFGRKSGARHLGGS